MKAIRIVLLVVAIIISCLCIIGIISIFYTVPFSFRSNEIDPILGDHLGNILQGVFGTLLTFVSIIVVLASIILTQENKRRDDIEKRVIELVKFHNENLSQISVMNKKGEIYKGRRAFIYYKTRLKHIKNLISEIYKSHGISPITYEEQILKITYLVFFFGFGKEYQYKIETYYGKIKDAQINYHILINELKTRNEKLCRNTEEGNLGHYFRLLYNIVMYVEKKRFLSKKSKYDLVKLLRVQLSNQEQVVLFYNSISDIGINWKKKELIEKYAMIKNINNYELDSIDIKKYYPKIKLEIDDLYVK